MAELEHYILEFLIMQSMHRVVMMASQRGEIFFQSFKKKIKKKKKKSSILDKMFKHRQDIECIAEKDEEWMI